MSVEIDGTERVSTMRDSGLLNRYGLSAIEKWKSDTERFIWRK